MATTTITATQVQTEVQYAPPKDQKQPLTIKVSSALNSTSSLTSSSWAQTNDIALKTLEVAVTCVLFHTKPLLFSIALVAGAFLFPAQVELVIKKTKEIWQQNQTWMLIGGGGAVFYLLPAQKWAIATTVFAAHLGHKLKANSELLGKASAKPEVSIIDRIGNVVEVIFRYSNILILPHLQPNLFAIGLIGGALLFPDYIELVAERVSLIWTHNKVWFIGIAIVMMFYALPAYLLIASSLYSAYLGYKLFSNSKPNLEIHKRG